MWALLATAIMAVLRRRSRMKWRRWRAIHRGLGLVIVSSSVAHALMIEGTMEPVSKTVICVLALIAALAVVRGVPARWLRLRRNG